VVSDILHNITVWLGGLGYLGVFVACFGIFPAEVVMAAVAAVRPDNLTEIALAASFGELIGAIPPYLIGMYFSKKDILGFLEKRGRLINVSKNSYTNGFHSIKKNGVLYLFLARFIPWLRVAASLVAGYVRYNYLIFSITVFIPTFFYAYGFAYAGAKIGLNWNEIKKIMDTFNYGVLFIILLGIGIYVYKNRKKISRNRKH
jgi:membrane protein DedA with SNARE-associated domain